MSKQIYNKEKAHQYFITWRNKYPGKYYLKWMHIRCNDPKKTYYRKGIKVRITEEEIEKLWERDKGYLLKKPSVERIDSNGDYTFENCRFIEFIDNCRIRATDRVNIITGETVRFKSVSDAARSVGIPSGKLWRIINSENPFLNYYWKFVDGRITKRKPQKLSRTREENTLYFREYRFKKKIAPIAFPMLLALRFADYRK